MQCVRGCGKIVRVGQYGLIAKAAQSHDLLNFKKLGQDMYELRIKAYVLKTPSKISLNLQLGLSYYISCSHDTMV